MRRSTHLMIAFSYYFAKLLGIINFSYDCRMRRAYKNKYHTIYAGIVNAAIFAIISYFAMTMKFKTLPPGSAELLYKISVLITFIHIGGVLVIITVNWSKRNEFIILINSYQNFCLDYLQKYQKQEQFMNYIEKSIRIKCKITLAAYLIAFTGSLYVFRDVFEISNTFLLLTLTIIPSTLPVIMLQFYFALQYINVLLIIINDELEEILKISTEYVGKLKGLSDYVNVLSQMVLKLENYVRRIKRMYELQGMSCMLACYVNNISIIYMTFMTSAPLNLSHQWCSFKGFGAFLALAILYYDLKFFFYSMFEASRLTYRLGKLLKFKQTLLSYGDAKLERSLMNFSLQVAAFPIEIDLMGLYVVNKPSIMALFVSALANAIVLMQYDFKYK